jgi:hypothetical protein
MSGYGFVAGTDQLFSGGCSLINNVADLLVINRHPDIQPKMDNNIEPTPLFVS